MRQNLRENLSIAGDGTRWVTCAGLLLMTILFGERLFSEDRSPASLPTSDAATKVPALTSADRDAMRQALGNLHGLIGGWRGVGQPVRNSNRGAWSETAEWIWEVKPGSLALLCQVQGGKLLRSARLTFAPKTSQYTLTAVLVDQSKRTYTGKFEGNRLTLETAADSEGIIHQIAITQLGDKRVTALFQSHPTGTQQVKRVAEVGYTRQGTRLAVEGSGGPECIVTGGKGTMTYVYKGKTYYFCCTGCRDAFLADPEGILAEAAKRTAEKKASP